MRDYGGFDHNRQSLRIVTELEQRYPEFPGLNLTWETREGMVKHESEYDVSDAREFNPDLRGNLETQICNVADELAYTTHDLDDGLRSGMITPHMLEGIALWEVLVESCNWRGPQLQDLDRHRMIRDLIGLQVTDMVEATEKRLKESRARSAFDIQKLQHNVIGYSEEMHAPQPGTQGLPVQQAVSPLPRGPHAGEGRTHLTELSTPITPSPLILPDHVQQWIAERGLERTICDYIAGMTDRYAIEEHARLHDPYLKT